jgi:UDP-glucose 4-epimerase
MVLTRSRPGRSVISRLAQGDLVIGDAADKRVLESALERVDQVVYAAGGLLPVASEREPDRDAELTLKPLRTTLEALRSRPDVRLLYLSSGGTVYGDPEKIPVGEGESTRPRGVYGELHVRCEEEILGGVRDDGLRAQILRCSTIYGEGQQPDRGQGVINTFISHVERGSPIELFGDGTTIRDYLYVDDLARIIVSLLDLDDSPTILNVGSGKGTSLIEIVRLVEQELDRPAKVIHHEERDFDVHRIVLDVSRLHQLVNVAYTPLVDGIRQTHRWLSAARAEAA